MRIRAGFEPHRGRTTALKLGRIQDGADLNGTPHPTAQIRCGPVSEVVPANCFVAGVPAKVIRSLEDSVTAE